jgi:membrane protease YdiL (CAAX protease family)
VILQVLAVNLMPILLLITGVGLLTREAWRQWRGSAPPPAALVGPPLSGVDLVLLIAGGFVVVGEVLLPLLIQAPLRTLLRQWAGLGPLALGLEVLLLYGVLMGTTLAILWMMLRRSGDPPPNGWLQWRWRPLLKAQGQALATVLMVLPIVALAGWMTEKVWGDPGGSNPLLDLVLTSSDPRALACFAFTAIVLAPLFEETLFRGVLFPVLGRHWGGWKAVLASAAVFAVAHLSLGELIPLFLLGLGLGWLRWRSGRLSGAIWMHGLWNGMTFVNLLLLAD